LKHGGLFWVLREGKRLAGCTFVHGTIVYRLQAIGAAHGDPSILELGAFVALYWAQIQHAHTLGCKEISFGGSRAFLSDGTLRFKRKFGARIVDPGHSARRLLSWTELNPTVIALLKHAPLIFQEKRHLSALSILDCNRPATQDEVNQAHRFLRMPGLYAIHLLSASGFAANVIAPTHTRLVDVNALQSGNVPELLVADALRPCRP
jgi:hypothetical protein